VNARGQGAEPEGNSCTAGTGRLGARRGVRLERDETLRYDRVATRPAGLQSKQGTSGEGLKLVANFFDVSKKPDWCIFNHSVDFVPDDGLEKRHKKRLLRILADSEPSLGFFIFNGTNLYSTQRIIPPEHQVSTCDSGNSVW